MVRKSMLLAAAAWLLSQAEFVAQAAEAPQFKAFPAGPVYNGPRPPLKLDKDGRAFRTRLREAYRGPVNFAGHYVVTYWGCGTTCIMGAALDVKTGRVLWFPGTLCCWREVPADFEPVVARADSRLIVLAGAINEDEGTMGAHFYEVTDAGLKLVADFPNDGNFQPSGSR